MATKTGISKLKNRLGNLRRDSAKILAKTNTLVAEALAQMKSNARTTEKPKPAARTARTAVRSAVKPAMRPAAAAPATQKKMPSTGKAVIPTRAAVPQRALPEAPARNRPAVAVAPGAAPGAVKAVALVRREVGSVLEVQLPTLPELRRLAPMKPSPDSRAGRATSKGKRAALSAARAMAISDGGMATAEGLREPL